VSDSQHEWTLTPIKESYLGLFDGPHATPPIASEGPIFLGIGNLRDDGHFDFSDVRHIDEQDFLKWTKRVTPSAGDIVFTYEATLNRYAIIPPGFRGCLGRRLALIRPNPSVVDTRFLFYSFFSPEWRETIARNIISGATVERIPLVKFPGFPIRLPPLQMQKQIANILSAYDGLIENNTRRIAILEEMARRIFEEWFIHFRAPGCEGLPMVDSAIGPMPQGWTLRKLGDLVDEGGGQIRTGPFGSQLHQSDYCSEGIPVVMPTDISSGRVDVSRIARISEETRDALSMHKLAQGDIVYGRRGDIGRKALIGPDQEGWLCGTGCIRVSVPKNLIEPLYIFYFLGRDDVRQRIAGQAIGATMPNLNTTIMRDVAVILPPKQLQAQFVEAAGDMDRLVRCLEQQNANLRAQRDLLLPKLISGEIDITAASASLKEAAE
jgi:type I restriction enzyme S subunit